MMDINSTEFKQLQTTLFDILTDIDQVCKDHEIDYFLAYGSMLGAIRHKDFIPWDDDMDIGMTRENYNKFEALFKNLDSDKYFLQTFHSDSGYGWPFAKFMKNGTTYMEGSHVNDNKRNGIFVDIFIFENAPNDPELQKKHLKRQTIYKRLLLMKSTYKHNDGISKIKLIRNHLINAILKLVPRSYIIRKLEAELHRYNDIETDYVTNFGDCYLYDKELITTLEEYPFRDKSFLGVKNYDQYLTQIYGDYMTLPKEEDRVPIHDIVELKF